MLWIVNLRYGWVRKKLRLSAEETAVASAAQRPPNSATTIVKTMNAKARLEAGVTPRNGISATPSAIAASGPLR